MNNHCLFSPGNVGSFVFSLSLATPTHTCLLSHEAQQSPVVSSGEPCVLLHCLGLVVVKNLQPLKRSFLYKIKYLGVLCAKPLPFFMSEGFRRSKMVPALLQLFNFIVSFTFTAFC